MDLMVDETLDARGLFCPEPVMMLHQAVRQPQAGQVLHVLAMTPQPGAIFPGFAPSWGIACCRPTSSGQQLLIRKD